MSEIMYNVHGDNVNEIRISAKEIAEMLYGSGSLINERLLSVRAQEGTEIHQYWQARYQAGDQSEVYVKTEVRQEDFMLEITGRIDGIVTRDKEVCLEEIKSTHRELDEMDETIHPAHLAQAKLYAYMYASEMNLKRITVLLTYVDVKTRNAKTIEKRYPFKTLQNYFDRTISELLKWFIALDKHENNRQKSIEGLAFPFPEYRFHQREMMAMVYRNILEQGILYVGAPTGIGKTIAMIFSALKAIKKPREKVFYLTAKNAGKAIALATISQLESCGLIAKTCEITAKDHMCFLPVRDCDPEMCQYAKDYYNRIYNAIRDIYSGETLFSQDVIRTYAKKHRVCPFELSLDLSNYADIVVCDYNYVFDPRVHLVRYFEVKSAEIILLVDEAHNLVQRSRDMYSASVSQKLFQTLWTQCVKVRPSVKREITRIQDLFQEFELELLDVDFTAYDEINDYLLTLLKRLLNKLDQALASEIKIPNRNQLMESYFPLVQFVKIAEFFDEDSRFLLERRERDVIASISCLDASKHVHQRIKESIEACTFFSATLEPITYYKNLLTQNHGQDVKMASAFSQKHLLLLCNDTISTRYANRKDSLTDLCLLAQALVSGKKGNYILFFPSYEYLKMVADILTFEEDVDVLIQTRDMTVQDRADTMTMFKNGSHRTQVGLFVMGGAFGESIDLIGDMLSGVMIIGVGLPALSPLNNILRSHFDHSYHHGFDYAYTYPGLNKVIQAVGRLIRTETDRGVAILVDDRFGSRKYHHLFPKEWSHIQYCETPEEIQERIRAFWNETED